MRSEVDLVDDEQIAAANPRAPLPRNLVSLGDVDHVDGPVGQLRRKRRGEIVAPRFDDDDLELRKTPLELAYRGQVDARILADRAVRTAPRLDADDSVERQRLAA